MNFLRRCIDNEKASGSILDEQEQQRGNLSERPSGAAFIRLSGQFAIVVSIRRIDA